MRLAPRQPWLSPAPSGMVAAIHALVRHHVRAHVMLHHARLLRLQVISLGDAPNEVLLGGIAVIPWVERYCAGGSRRNGDQMLAAPIHIWCGSLQTVL